MTLIAAFEVAKTHTLIGDFLITKNGESHSVSKKILKLTDNIAIGWTGHLLAAQVILPDIRHLINDRAYLSADDFKQLLTEDLQVDCGNLSIHLIGWIVDENEKFCFRWNSSYPIELYFSHSMFDGSGEPFAKKIISEQGIISTEKSDEAPDSNWLEKALLITCGRLMNTEIFEKSISHDFYSGFCFESIFFSEEKKFKEIDEILYFGMTFTFDENNRAISSTLTDKIIKYESIGKVSKVSVSTKSLNTTEIHLITEPGDENTDYYKSYGSWSGFLSKFYCIGIKLESPTHKPFYSILIDIPKDGESEITKRTTKENLGVNISRSLIEQIYNLYLKESNPATNPAIF